ncbi:MAG: ribosomal subunit interface protein [Bacteroidetes bacterium RIFCSPLOWO2_12_FULL_31_6]|nr:MAG: ribosomal subunit interface protein [Bacteroidetes bacterium RIFCSPLOWO2_12_FULL_31_6]
MKIVIQSPHFTPKQVLTDFVTEKVNKLSHFYDRIESAKVCLKLEKSDTTENKICEIELAVPGNNLFAKRSSRTFEEATTEAIHAIQNQMDKLKSKSKIDEKEAAKQFF